ncbi:hypothetical protein CVIRNUC_008157 [Coccomyxa viridis]|uniref:Uncharacterized protein n=1 Tax=Coccomyxa viridis TaxID=1274662 RepID=A0AAV1ICU9_9CHLO|nr:hypothetical protein CVIRNUC_008157 [Coccomyxa viridis]
MMEIVKVETSGDELYDVLLREKQMDQRRRDQKEHSHKHIWTKEPHGGRYRDTFSHGYDALKERPDGKYLKVLPGYERPQCGPTTNFVGNHMTQGAIDLVQMELQPAADPNVRLLELNPHVDTKLLALDSTEAASETGPGPQALPVQEYSWQDKGSHIHVRVTSTGHVAGSTSIKISDTGFCLRYTEQTNAAKPETCHRALSINPLYAEVMPEVSGIIETVGDIMAPKAKQSRGRHLYQSFSQSGVMWMQRRATLGWR